MKIGCLVCLVGFSKRTFAFPISSIMSTQYDAIIIGSGAGGGTLAFHLARAGKKILILERGPFHASGETELGHFRGLPREPLSHQGNLAG